MPTFFFVAPSPSLMRQALGNTALNTNEYSLKRTLGLHRKCEYGSPVVKVLDHCRHVVSSSPVPLKTRRVGKRCTLNMSRAQTSSRWCGS
ncbi:hypothetical protein TNCV_1879111 [Trichonephila clavipes]|nr:hypothetical protein TNCV_1879111 [Trichonephila clavipes]